MSEEKAKAPKKAPAKKAATKKASTSKSEEKAKATPKAKAAPKAKAVKSVAATGVPVSTNAAAAEPKPRPTHEQIAVVAYRYYEERGWRDGFDEQDWFRAEAELLAAS